MEYIEDLQRSRPLLTVLLRLTGLCIKTRQNRAALTRPELRAVAVMLRLLALCLRADPELVAGPPGGPTVTQQLLQVRTHTALPALNSRIPPNELQVF